MSPNLQGQRVSYLEITLTWNQVKPNRKIYYHIQIRSVITLILNRTKERNEEEDILSASAMIQKDFWIIFFILLFYPADWLHTYLIHSLDLSACQKPQMVFTETASFLFHFVQIHPSGSTKGVGVSWQRAGTDKAEEKEQMRVSRQYLISHSSLTWAATLCCRWRHVLGMKWKGSCCNEAQIRALSSLPWEYIGQSDSIWVVWGFVLFF